MMPLLLLLLKHFSRFAVDMIIFQSMRLVEQTPYLLDSTPIRDGRYRERLHTGLFGKPPRTHDDIALPVLEFPL